MAVITICREVAAGGGEIGKRVAKRLDYQFLDKSLLQKIAEDLQVSERALKSFENSREYRVSNLFAKIYSKKYIQRIVGHDRSVVEEEEYQKSLKQLIIEVARDDNVVILGRGAYYFLQGMDNTYHFRLVAPFQWRKQYAIDRLGISRDRADAYIDRRDKNRVWFHRSICGDKCYEPTLFHLTINTAQIGLDKATDFIIETLQR